MKHFKCFIATLLSMTLLLSTTAGARSLSNTLTIIKDETRLCKWVKDGEVIEKEITFSYMNLGIEHKRYSDKIRATWHLSVNGWEVIDPPMLWNGCNLGTSYQLEEGDSYSIWSDPIHFYSPGAIVINTSDYDHDDAFFDVYDEEGKLIGGRRTSRVPSIIEIPRAGNYTIRFDRHFPDEVDPGYPSYNNNAKIFCYGTEKKDVYNGGIEFTSKNCPMKGSTMAFPYDTDITFNLNLRRGDKVKVELIRAGQTWGGRDSTASVTAKLQGSEDLAFSDEIKLNGKTQTTAKFPFETKASGTYEFKVRVDKDWTLNDRHGFVMRVVAPNQDGFKYSTLNGDTVNQVPDGSKPSSSVICFVPYKKED